ncbi:DNA repair protein RecN [Bermanella marisrubri]|uniref:DNA repair protein RecN n=1 Tax=Bermanella marisrubri TaxID=207949 RepID=Q1N391_9GAMM|nr:DNA repair protein RecN [Bermanella marisrubri]EAT12700.1 DNA repair protein RecN [Oceanobacter sp. RED65] [Bermanella marisrubri]QIZ85179.1 DNA repair protein RecN [Bermanella marisrubri]
MLTHISIKDFTIVDSLELDLKQGFSAVTGETGAGKSIMLDALSLATGQKADAKQVRPDAQKAEIYACFDIAYQSTVSQWLHDNDLEGDGEQLILSRIITNEGRSRGYINGRPVSLQQLKHVGQSLLDIHGQHAHQQLLHKDSPRLFLDAYGEHENLLQTVKSQYQEWQSLNKKLDALQNQSDEVNARIQLLEYQVEELDILSLEKDEIESLEKEQKRLANAEHHLLTAQQALQLCRSDEDQIDAYQAVQMALQKLDPMVESDTKLQAAHELLNQAQVALEESANELHHYIDGFEINPQRLQQVEERLNTIYELARKHKVRPEELFDLHQDLANELADITHEDASLESLQAAQEKAQEAYSQSANQLSDKRQKAAAKLAKALLSQLKELALDKAQLEFQVTPHSLHEANSYGLDDIELMISLNPGQPMQPMHKVASGGELSRISLALQILIQRGPNTLIFDEIDVGVGGATAERMGRLLKSLGEHKQVISVTHQPQVAALSHQHLLVNKLSGKKQTRTQIRELSADQRQHELARMMGGLEITDTTLAHARDMLHAAQA